MKKINKKGQVSVGLVVAIFLGIIFLLFLSGGGLTGAWNLGNLIVDITKFMKTIPTFAWIILGVVIVYWLFGKKK